MSIRELENNRPVSFGNHVAASQHANDCRQMPKYDLTKPVRVRRKGSK